LLNPSGEGFEQEATFGRAFTRINTPPGSLERAIEIALIAHAVHLLSGIVAVCLEC